MNDPLKPRIDFEQPLAAPHDVPLRPAEIFTENGDAAFRPVAESSSGNSDDSEGRTERLLTSALKPRPSLWRRMVIAGIGLFAVSAVAQGGLWLSRAWQQQDWLALGSLGAGGLIVLAGVGALATEWRRLRRLRLQTEHRDTAAELLSSQGLGNARPFCETLAANAGIGAEHPAWQRYLAALHDSQSDREVVQLYATLVQPVVDKQVRREISRSAAESALMVAVSPLAIVDMAFIAWRNLRLINRVAALYGIDLGYFSRIRLFKVVLINIAFAGVTEWVREIGVDWMSQDLAARLSARAAQGIGAGLLTARLGIKTMELCRPLPWTGNDRPRMGDFRREIIGQLQEALRAKKKND